MHGMMNSITADMATKMSNPNIIDRTVVNNRYVVSTVLLAGADRMPDLYGGRVFETMVFPCDEQGIVTDWIEQDCQRYRTLDEARTGHKDMVLTWINKD